MKQAHGDKDMRSEPPDLQTWRSRALYAILIILATAGFVGYGSTILNAVVSRQMTPLLWVYAGVYVSFLALTVLPRLSVPVRSSMVFLLAYVNAAASFARVGLAGSGRLYLVFVPAAAVILLGSRAGWLCLGISLLLYGGFGFLAAQGVLARWITMPENPLSASYWIEAGIALAVFLVTLTVLMSRFFINHVRTLEASRRTSQELEKAYAALEQRVGLRTRELGLLNSVAAVITGRVDLAGILDLSLRRTMEAFDVETGGAYELQGDTLVMLAHAGLSDSFVQRMERLPLEIGLAGKQLTLEHPLTWSLQEYPPGPLRQAIEAEGLELIIAVPLAVKGRVLGGLVMNSRRERTLTPEELSLLIAVGQQIGLAMENARLLEREIVGRADADRRREVAEGLRETLAVLNSHRPLPEILDFIVSQACRIMGSDSASLLQNDSACCVYRVSASCGLDKDLAGSVLYSDGQGGAGGAIEARQPIAFPDIEKLSERQRASLIPEHPEDRHHRELLLAHGIKATLSVPLIVRNETFGAITLYYRQPRQFSAEEVRLATALADQAALAVDNAHLHEEAERAAALAERNRLARELHDSVTQSLYSVTLYAEAAARLLGAGKTGSAAEHLRELGSTAREALREMRLLIFELNPPALEKGSLVDALQIRLDAVEARGGMTVGFQVEGTERLAAPVRQELYQIAQEALNNAIRHAHAQSVKISLRFQKTGCELAISDDGVGFETDQARRGGGLGLRGMRERVERFSGTLDVNSSPGAGTRVRVVAPGA
ncbi:MAG: GAF domain-containing sensor histidine kinase [Spirochaetia bacterium]|jgi:signal transduction histidine kinase